MEWKEAWETLGGRIGWVREERLGLKTHEALAQWLKALPDSDRPKSTSQSSVWRYEEGERPVPTDFLTALARHVPVNPAWLLLNEGDPDEVSRPHEATQKLRLVQAVLDGRIREALEDGADAESYAGQADAVAGEGGQKATQGE